MGSIIIRQVLLTAVLLALGLHPAAAEDRLVTGNVSDDSGRPLPGASVAARARDASVVAETITDESGWYRLQIRPGSYELRFTLVNFGDVTKTIVVASDETPLLVPAVLPLAFAADVVVTGHRTFRNIAEVEHPAENLIGLAGAASEGAVTAKQLESRPLARPGDVLETVPGLVISQHSGEGKANQYYLRGFNLDHGTDFAVSVAGIPVNMPTHGHGQGWSDVNFLIPELVSGIQFRKGPYYAEEGDFSTAGAANINYVSVLDHPIARFTTGGNGFRRALAAASPRIGTGHLLVALETGRNDGPWVSPEQYRRLNGVVRYSQGDTQQGFSITAMGYHAQWNATDQIPRRAVEDGLVPRFGTLDASDGGDTHRHTLSAEVQRSGNGHTTKVLGYVMDYGLDLFSNFTYLLNDPVNGDQFEQLDQRRALGGRISHRRQTRWLGRTFEHRMGTHVRHDQIGALGLYSTRARQRLATTRFDRVRQTSTGMYYQGELDLSDRFRAAAGLRGDVYRFAVHSDRSENSGTALGALLSPKLGVVFSPVRAWELYGNFGFGYHSNDARGATLSIDPITDEATDPVTPLVRTRGGEIGVRTVVIPKVQTTVALWGLTLDSEFVFAGDVGTTEAGRRSRRVGIEWANYYSPRPWLTIDADLSLSSARFTDGDPVGSAIPGAVRQVASVGASIIDVHRLSTGVRVRYLGPRPLVEDATVTSGRSLLTNITAGYTVARDTRLVLDVLNLFDARDSDTDYFYRSRLPGDPAGGVDAIHTHPVAPGTVRLGLHFNF